MVGQLESVLQKIRQQPANLSELAGVVERCLNDFDLRQAQALAKQLELSLVAIPQGLQPSVRGMIARLKFLALPLYLNREDILSPFRVGLGAALRYETPDIIQRIRAKLLDFWIGNRDQWRQDIITTLHQNTDVITSAGPSGTNQNLPGTVAIWLSNYDQVLGADLIDNIKIIDYLFRTKWTKVISSEDRAVLRKLFNIYEYLKLSSTSALGVEEELDFVEGGVIKDFDQGLPKPILDLRSYTKGSQFDDGLRSSSLPIQNLVKPVVKGMLSENRMIVPKTLEPTQSTPTILKTSEPVATKPATASQPAVTKSATPAPVALLQPVPQALKSSEPAFMFDAQDELEADKYRSKSKSSEEGVILEKELRSLAEEVIKKYNFSFKDETKHRRFVQLFVSHLKDVRDVVELREALLKSAEVGGLGLDSDKAEQVVKIIESAKKEFETRNLKPEARKPVTELEKLVQLESANASVGIKNQESPQQSTVVDATGQVGIRKPELEKVISPATATKAPAIEPAPQQIPATPTTSVSPVVPWQPPKVELPSVVNKLTFLPPPQTETKAQDLGKKIASPMKVAAPAVKTEPSAEVDKAKLERWREEMLQEIARVAPPTAAPIPNAQILISKEAPNPKLQNTESKMGSSEQKVEVRRPRVEDVKAPPRTLGPLEELKSLSLVDFRRLSPSASEALDKIKAKIELIGEASVAKRLEAVRAWQNSVVYQLYLKLGRASIEQGKTIAALIKEFAARGEATLTEQEFEAVVDFNVKLRF
ncbi:MAG: hypothetical protein HY973_00825 [Candidatus Kerfeldbacteria bacterium]|nr:hypothetical protein [Candidatus Kerfeldbacteria bacterium]